MEILNAAPILKKNRKRFKSRLLVLLGMNMLGRKTSKQDWERHYERIARRKWLYFQTLKKAGFSPSQAIQIVAKS